MGTSVLGACGARRRAICMARMARAVPLLACLVLFTLLYALRLHSSSSSQQPLENQHPAEPSEYTKHTYYGRASATLLYGPTKLLRAAVGFVSDSVYSEFIRSMPIVCVDVAIMSRNHKILLVKRHNEPVRGVDWWTGGRLFKGETF